MGATCARGRSKAPHAGGAGATGVGGRPRNWNPPQEAAAAFRDVNNADQDKSSAVNEADAYRNRVVNEAKGDAAKITREAQGYREQSVREATGDAERLRAVGA